MADASVYQAVHPSNGKGFKRTIPGGDSAGSGGAVAGGADGQFVRLEGDEMDGPLSTTELTVEDQAGAGSRAVFANEYGEQQAVAEAVWTPGVYSPIGGTPGWTTPSDATTAIFTLGPCIIGGKEYAALLLVGGYVAFLAVDGTYFIRGQITTWTDYYGEISPDGTVIKTPGESFNQRKTYRWNGATWDASLINSAQHEGPIGATFFWRFNTDAGNARYVYLIDLATGTTLATHDLGETGGAYGYPIKQFASLDRSVLVFMQATADTVKVVSVARGLESLPIPSGFEVYNPEKSIISREGDTVIALMKSGSDYYAVRWDYSGGSWAYTVLAAVSSTLNLAAMGDTWFSGYQVVDSGETIYSRETGALLATTAALPGPPFGGWSTYGRFALDGTTEFYANYAYGGLRQSASFGVYTPSLLDIASHVEVDKLTVVDQAGTGVRLVAAGADGTQAALANPTSEGSYGSASETLTATIDTQGRVNAMADVSIQIAESQVTNLPADLVRSLRYAWSIA